MVAAVAFRGRTVPFPIHRYGVDDGSLLFSVDLTRCQFNVMLDVMECQLYYGVTEAAIDFGAQCFNRWLDSSLPWKIPDICYVVVKLSFRRDPCCMFLFSDLINKSLNLFCSPRASGEIPPPPKDQTTLGSL